MTVTRFPIELKNPYKLTYHSQAISSFKIAGLHTDQNFFNNFNESRNLVAKTDVFL